MNKLTLSISALLIALIVSFLVWLSMGNNGFDDSVDTNKVEITTQTNKAQLSEDVIGEEKQNTTNEQKKPEKIEQYSNIEPFDQDLQVDELSENDKKIAEIIAKIRAKGGSENLTDQTIKDLLENSPWLIDELTMDEELKEIIDNYFDFNYTIYFEHGPLSVESYDSVSEDFYLSIEPEFIADPGYISAKEQEFIDLMESQGGVNIDELFLEEGIDFSSGYIVFETFDYDGAKKNVMFYFEESPFTEYYLDTNNIADKNLKKCVEDEIKQREKNLEYLFCYRTIKSLQGLEGAVSIQTLYVQFSGLIDLSPISQYKNLKTLDIYLGRDLDGKQLESLTSLKSLALNTVSIKNSESIKNLTDLTHLTAYHAKGLDLSVINDLENLKELYIIGDYFNEIDFSELTQLEELVVYSSPDINLNLSALNKLRNLKTLRLFNTGITVLPKLENSQLIELEIEGAELGSISSLSDYKSLKILKLKNSKISKLPNMEMLYDLQLVDFSGNLITDLSFLENSQSLKMAYVFNNGITDLSHLYSLPNLILLHAQGNQITNISGIERLSQLQDIILIGNPIEDCYPATKLKNLMDKHWCETVQ